jgi:hypothetical protein
MCRSHVSLVFAVLALLSWLGSFAAIAFDVDPTPLWVLGLTFMAVTDRIATSDLRDRLQKQIDELKAP